MLLWPDAVLEKITRTKPKFTEAERLCFLNAVCCVSQVIEADAAALNALPENLDADLWVDVEATTNDTRKKSAAENKILYRVFTADELKGFPEPLPMPSAPGKTKIVATGCYDWFHSGHVRFTEEAPRLTAISTLASVAMRIFAC